MSCNRRLLSAAFLALALFVVSCRRSASSPQSFRRLAVLPMEDLSSSASHAWLARLIPFAVVRQLEGEPHLLAAEVRSAVNLPDATHQLAGYVTVRNGAVRAHLFLYELPSHQLVRQQTLSQPASRWRQLLAGVAAFTASALQSPASLQPVAVRNESAARRLAEALNAATAGQSQAAFRAAAEDDPLCGWCWLGWADTAVRRGDREQAFAAVDNAAFHRDSLDVVSRSRLDLIAANLRLDTRAAASSLETLANATPGDASAHARLAEALVASRQFDKAAAALQRAISIEPSTGLFWNSLAYAHAYAGRFDEALKAVARYAQLDSSPNPADSRGEILMMAGRFTEAYKAFDESYRKDPAFNNGAALEKAALCWMLSGDPHRTAETIGRYLDDLAGRNDLALELRRARWEFLSGQSSSARQLFSRFARDSANPLAPLASAMLALRVSLSDPSAAAALLRAMPPSRDGLQEIYAAYASSAADPAFPDRVRDDRLKLELRALSLTARRDWTRAAEAWKNVIERSPGGADSAYRELRAFCLVQTGDTTRAAEALGNSWPLLAQGQMEFYDFLVYPNLLFTRAEIARASGRVDEARRLYDIFLQFAGNRADLAPLIARARSASRL